MNLPVTWMSPSSGDIEKCSLSPPAFSSTSLMFGRDRVIVGRLPSSLSPQGRAISCILVACSQHGVRQVTYVYDAEIPEGLERDVVETRVLAFNRTPAQPLHAPFAAGGEGGTEGQHQLGNPQSRGSVNVANHGCSGCCTDDNPCFSKRSRPGNL